MNPWNRSCLSTEPSCEASTDTAGTLKNQSGALAGSPRNIIRPLQFTFLQRHTAAFRLHVHHHRRVPRSTVMRLDTPRLGRTASSCASGSCGSPGGVTIRCQVYQRCQGDPEPAPASHTSVHKIDQDIGQGSNRQDEDSQQWQNPAPMKCPVDQRGC